MGCTTSITIYLPIRKNDKLGSWITLPLSHSVIRFNLKSTFFTLISVYKNLSTTAITSIIYLIRLLLDFLFLYSPYRAVDTQLKKLGRFASLKHNIYIAANFTHVDVVHAGGPTTFSR